MPWYIYMLHNAAMRILKTHPILKLVNSYVVDSPQPSNISYMWNMGSLLALCLIIQIITGITLAMHYNPSVVEAFNSVEHIMRDVNNGWLVRYLHANTASAFFFLVYLHIARGLYYGSYKAPRTLTWVIGTIIFILMMATAFLGYYYSPIWLELFLNIFIYTYTSLFTFSLVIFYLDDFRLSQFNLIKYIQLFSFIIIPFALIIYSYNYAMAFDVINSIKDSNDNVDLHAHGHIAVDKETGKAIGQGLNTIGSQIGLGATMAGVSGAVAKGIAKSGMPPLQKAGVIFVASAANGLVHSRISALNRISVYQDNANITAYTSKSNIGSQVNKLLDDSIVSPLQELLFEGEIMNYLCLSIIYILIIQLVYKLYLKDNINLNLYKLLGNNLNSKLEYYINKIIKLNKQMSIGWIWFILIIIIFALSIDAYVINNILSNFDSFIDVHCKFNPDILLKIYPIDISMQSIRDIFLNLKIINYISLITIANITLLIILKLHFNKNIKTIYIWLAILVLIITLALSAHSYGDLYTHIDTYVNAYVNFYK